MNLYGKVAFHQTLKSMSDVYGFDYRFAKEFFDKKIDQGIPPAIALTMSQTKAVMEFPKAVNLKVTEGLNPLTNLDDYDVEDAYQLLKYLSVKYIFSFERAKKYFDNLTDLNYTIEPAISLTKLHFIHNL